MPKVKRGHAEGTKGSKNKRKRNKKKKPRHGIIVRTFRELLRSRSPAEDGISYTAW